MKIPYFVSKLFLSLGVIMLSIALTGILFGLLFGEEFINFALSCQGSNLVFWMGAIVFLLFMSIMNFVENHIFKKESEKGE